MRILFASVEVAPWAKVGGLADVAGSLPHALQALGHDIRLLMPAYGLCLDGAEAVELDLTVRVNATTEYPVQVWKRDLGGVEVWLIGTPGMFERANRSEEVYAFGPEAYLFLAEASLAVCKALRWIPDVIHANDWHTGFFPVMLREKGGKAFADTASTFTIHNLHYQGVFGREVVGMAGLSDSLFVPDRLETFGAVNFIKSACVYADQVNTVSPTYSVEVTTPEYGEGLWGLMGPMRDAGKFRGILNGIDYRFFNPETDKFVAAPFSASDPSGKAACKAALQKACGFAASPDTPVVGIVSRLSDQKGYDLILRQAYGMLALGAQLVALGTGDPWSAGELRKLAAEWPGQVHFAERYDAPFAQVIYAGSDLFLMPSAFEPCGLGQMIACRYGTLPLVRRTGGLADTIHDGVNGFVFEERSAKALFDTVRRALEIYRHEPRTWHHMVHTAMTTDFSWSERAKDYVAMYEDAVAARRAPSPVG